MCVKAYGIIRVMKHFKIMLASFLLELRKRHLQVYAGSTAFFFLLSIVPLMILAGVMVPVLGIKQEVFMDFLSSLSPDVIDIYIERIVMEAYSLSNSLLPVTMIILLYSCSGGMMGLMFGLNRVYDVNKEMNYLHIRLLATFYTLILMAMITTMLVFVILGDTYLLSVLKTLPNFGLHLIYDMRYLILFIAGVLILTLTYKLVPRENQPLIEQTPGAIFTMIGWVSFTKLFSMFVTGDRYATLFGRFAVLIIAMMWVYWCIYIVLIGGYINWYFRYFFRQGLRQLEEKRESKK